MQLIDFSVICLLLCLLGSYPKYANQHVCEHKHVYMVIFPES